VVRAKLTGGLQDAYDRLWADIQEHGYRARFLRNVNHYLDITGWRYWTCDLQACAVSQRPCPHRFLPAGCVINRDLVSTPPPDAQLRLGVDE
jgi:hypothetical protein